MVDTANAILQRFEALTVWQRAGERAPHKPLLLLLALALYRQGVRVVPYIVYEAKLVNLLREFGPSRRTLHPEYPFLRLRNDCIWEVNRAGQAVSVSETVTGLRSSGAVGRFPADVQATFKRNPLLVSEIAKRLLAAHFPESLHQDILDAVGLSLEEPCAHVRQRDPNFRNAVLLAYQYRCALCDLDLRINNVTVGLEAAHIKWHQANGPDSVDNGVALCALHHKLFDLGAFTFEPDRTVLISERVSGAGLFDHVLLRHHQQLLSAPVRAEHLPQAEFVRWHRSEVFKERPRPR